MFVFIILRMIWSRSIWDLFWIANEFNRFSSGKKRKKLANGVYSHNELVSFLACYYYRHLAPIKLLGAYSYLKKDTPYERSCKVQTLGYP